MNENEETIIYRWLSESVGRLQSVKEDSLELPSHLIREINQSLQRLSSALDMIKSCQDERCRNKVRQLMKIKPSNNAPPAPAANPAAISKKNGPVPVSLGNVQPNKKVN